MSEPDNDAKHKLYVEAIEYLETITTGPATREIERSIKVVKVRVREI